MALREHEMALREFQAGMIPAGLPSSPLYRTPSTPLPNNSRQMHRSPSVFPDADSEEPGEDTDISEASKEKSAYQGTETIDFSHQGPYYPGL